MRKISMMLALFFLGMVCLLPLACGISPISPNIWGNGIFKTAIIPPGSGTHWHLTPPVTPFPQLINHTALVFNGKMWILGGYELGAGPSNRAFSSTDGATWTNAALSPFNPRDSHASVVFNGRMVVIGGHGTIGARCGNLMNDVWASSDGVNWTQLSSGPVSISPDVFSPRQSHSAVSFINKIWVFGGSDCTSTTFPHFNNDVWSSIDGSHWVQVDVHAPFSPRDGQSSVVFGGYFWVIGGRSAISGFTNDVWYSKDGFHWNLATSSAPFSPRAFHVSMVYGGAMWVIGGGNDSIANNDAWFSYDGITWTEAGKRVAFNPREMFAGVAYNPATGSGMDGKMWIFGGFTPTFPPFYVNDVWYSP